VYFSPRLQIARGARIKMRVIGKVYVWKVPTILLPIHTRVNAMVDLLEGLVKLVSLLFFMMKYFAIVEVNTI